MKSLESVQNTVARLVARSFLVYLRARRRDEILPVLRKRFPMVINTAALLFLKPEAPAPVKMRSRPLLWQR